MPKELKPSRKKDIHHASGKIILYSDAALIDSFQILSFLLYFIMLKFWKMLVAKMLVAITLFGS